MCGLSNGVCGTGGWKHHEMGRFIRLWVNFIFKKLYYIYIYIYIY